MNLEQTRQLAWELRLYGIQAHLERRAAQAVSEQLHPLEFLRLVLQDEQLARKDRVSKMLATRGRFRTSAELEDWDSTFDRGLTKARFKELALLNFYHNQQNLILLGKTGEGKTHLAVALGRKLCAEGIKTTFLPVNLLFEELAAARASGSYLDSPARQEACWPLASERVVLPIQRRALRSRGRQTFLFDGVASTSRRHRTLERAGVCLTDQDPSLWYPALIIAD